jgi:O-antigen/teichoic acid export membrane protein
MYFKIVLVGSCVTAGLAIAATPLIGIVGTAAAVSAGEAVMVALFLYALRSHDILGDARELAHVLGAASAMAIAAWALARVSPFAAVAVGLVMYAGVLAALKAVSRDDLALLREVGG